MEWSQWMDGVNAKLYKYNVLLKHSIQKLLYNGFKTSKLQECYDGGMKFRMLNHKILRNSIDFAV